MISYLDLLRDVSQNGEPHYNRTDTPSLSVFGRQWRHDMREGFPLLTTKRVPLRWVFEELRWFLSGSTSVFDLQSAGVDIWDEWATAEECAKFGREPGDLGPIYGSLWRWFGDPTSDLQSDQIYNLLQDIAEQPGSRRLIVSGWHPVKQREVSLPPCHTLWQIKIHRDGGMSLHLYARSIDIFLGLPFNIASYGLLLMMLAHVTDRTPRDLIISFGDLHLYTNHVEQAKEQLSRDPHPLPTVRIADTPSHGSTLAELLAIRWHHVRVDRYRCHPKIAAPVAV